MDNRRLKIRIKDDITNTILANLTIHIDKYDELAIDEESSGDGFYIDNIDTYLDEKGDYEFAGITLNIIDRLTLKDK